jgi:UDP-N-acetyl-D-mannosaminuronate dehydrogenase
MNAITAGQDTKVAVFGLGYVGCVTAACFADIGHRVTGVDKDPYKVEKVRAGEAPFFEPGLPEAVRKLRCFASALPPSVTEILGSTSSVTLWRKFAGICPAA